MKSLDKSEWKQFLDDNYESEFGCVAVEGKVSQFAKKEATTGCGQFTSHVFEKLASNGYGDRTVKGWYLEEDENFQGRPTFHGMIHIECEASEEPEKIEDLVVEERGSLRASGPSKLDGFWEFEIE